MSEGSAHLALFNEIDPATEAIALLRDLGVPDHDMTIISGVPYSERILGRPITWTRVPQIAIAGFLVGFIVSILFNWGSVLQYPIRVGGMPLFSIPPTLVLTFEFSMLGLMISTFLGVLWESYFPSFGPKVYHPDIADGRIGVVFECPPDMHDQMHQALSQLGAEWVHRTEAQNL
ncbi:MAG TPA: quinol:electron acceptor oxidoreductase subunit ActD [Anaerolineales bacterium]|nr:quinol:electron acceptor oxidoreductase subunit ActD [Anaerolineales bacterium]